MVEAEKVAKELGVDISPPAPRKRAARKRNPSRNGPVIVEFKWSAVLPQARLHALFLADQDIRRCEPINRNTVVVRNNPGKVPR